MAPLLPPEEIARFMQFIAEKSKNLEFPMSIRWLATQFKETTGSPISVQGMSNRIETYRHRTYFMKEFDMVTEVEMIFALSTPVNDWFLNEMKKVADVEVDYKQRILKYEQKDGKLELFLAEKTKTVNTPVADRCFLFEFKTIYQCLDFIGSLEQRYARLKKTIYQLPGIDKNTKVKMMFISHATVSDDILEEYGGNVLLKTKPISFRLCKDTYVEVDHKRRISKYKANDGSLELEGGHSLTAMGQAEIKRKFPAEISMGMKRARKVSEKHYAEESMKVENDSAMDPYANNADNWRYDYFVEEKPENLLEVKIEVPEAPSTSIGGDNYIFHYDSPNHKDDLEHISVEKKPESLIEVKLDEPVNSSTSGFGYHYEENLEHDLNKT